MVNVNELRGRMVASNITYAEMAKKLGITSKTFSLRMKNKIFMSNEIDVMLDVLNLEKDEAWKIFFDQKVTRHETKEVINN